MNVGLVNVSNASAAGGLLHPCVQAEKARGSLQLVESLQAQLAASRKSAEALQTQMAELQQHNKELQQEVDAADRQQADLIQTLSRSRDSRAKRPRTSDVATLEV